MIDGVIATVPRGDHVGTFGIRIGEQIVAVQMVGHFRVAERQRGRGDVERGNELVADDATTDGRMVSFHHERNVHAAFVAKLFVPQGLIVAVIGEEKYDGVF